MGSQDILSRLEGIADRIFLHEQRLIEVLSKENSCRIDDCAALFDANNMVDACPVENFSSKLTVTRSNEHEFKRGNVHFKQVLQLFLRYEMSRGVFFLEHEAVTLVLHQIGVLAKRSCIVLDSMPREM